MAKLALQYELAPGGVELYLTEEKRSLLLKRVTQRLDVDKWDSQSDLHALSGLAKLSALIEFAALGMEDSHFHVKELPEGDGYFVPHDVIADFTEGQALSLGFPVSVPYQLRISPSGPLLDNSTHINARWYSTGRLVRGERIGALLEVGDTQYRIPEPTYSALNAIDSFNDDSSDSLDDRIAKLAGLSNLLQQDSSDLLDLERSLKDLRISHATALSLDLKPRADGLDFDPLLFGQEILDEVEDTGEQITDSAHLLTPQQQDKFAQTLFRRYETARPAYVIDKGTYLFIDPSLRPVLEVVRQQQQSDSESKKRFARNPAGFIKQRIMGDDNDDPELSDALEKMFIETTGFSERVKELGLWVPRTIPWLQREPNSWIPEKFGIRIGDQIITVGEHDLDTTISIIQDGVKNALPTVTLPDGSNIIPTNDAVEALDILKKELAPPPEDIEQDQSENVVDESQEKELPQATSKHVLVVEENVEEVLFEKNFSKRAPYLEPEITDSLKNTPKHHQIEGIGWLQECWSEGYPGALLADDMGLGKTFQTLGFLGWLQIKRHQLGLPRSPVLIVAPTSLLNNWLDEETIHLHTPGLGQPGLLFGKSLKEFKEKSGSNDVIQGESTLNTSELMECDWLLTTYETLRDYHISIGKLKLSCVVFDEMQKVKNPDSMNTAAAQTLNADFSLGLTGTPVENSLSDLWCIMDILMPGFLGGLKAFMDKYPEDDHVQLTTLRSELLERSSAGPQPILRRMKSDILTDLPQKKEYVLDEHMTGGQAQAYDQLIKRVKKEEEKKGARLIHQFRMLSLHPNSPGSEASNDADQYISESARLRTVFAQLDKIADKKEKALIFLESLAMQEWLAFVIKHRYRLKQLPPRIYGDIPASERKHIVDRFQERKDQFGVMILSPKAGGVGLTITAATNVIHLSRWWNPAVEDQCTDRAYRIGQDREVNVYIPRAIHPAYGDGSFDVILHDLLERKRSLSKTMLVPMEGKDDIDYVFSKI